MRAVFMGTPDIAASVLSDLLESKHEIIAVVTQPDRVKGRGSKTPSMTPVKELALRHDIPVLQPQKVKLPEEVEKLRALNPDVILVVAFGQILSKEILDLPKYGCINVHASLLPEYRGAAPIQWAVIDGKEKSGVTIMKMDPGIDTGDMILVKETMLCPEETGESLHDRLAKMAGPALLEALEQIENNTAVFTPQPQGEYKYAKMLTKEMGNLDFQKSAVELERLIRGLNSWPSAYTSVAGKIIKFWRAQAEETVKCKEVPGTLLSTENGVLTIATGKGVLMVQEVQLEGKKRMTVGEFLRGFSLEKGYVFGSLY